MRYKIVVYVPIKNADAVRDAIGRAGGGKLGKYSFCSFSTKGTGRFLPNQDANPHIGEPGKLEAVEEERIEISCHSVVLRNVIAAIKQVHPYEEIALDVYQIQEFEQLG